MSKRTLFTTVTALPAGISRETVLETLHNHTEMIDLNPLVMERHPIRPPKEATPEEITCAWYQITDKVNYLPGGLYSGSVTFKGCFHNLPNGLQTHIHAPAGLEMKGRWTLGGSLPGEPREAVELGANIPKTGLWLKEDVDMRCNFVMTSFVKGTTKKAHGTLVSRLMEKAHKIENDAHNNALAEQLSLRSSYPPDYHASMVSPTQYTAHGARHFTASIPMRLGHTKTKYLGLNGEEWEEQSNPDVFQSREDAVHECNLHEVAGAVP
ncbi:hypothetical protein P7C71_g3746, partial [Lecanoromycetidae sp. Uapishka_2]